MKALLLIAALFSAQAFAYDVYTQGYQRADGRFVQGYERTAPNHDRFDNYSTRGNVNPYTGSYGTVNPNPQPSSFGSQGSNWR